MDPQATRVKLLMSKYTRLPMHKRSCGWELLELIRNLNKYKVGPELDAAREKFRATTYYKITMTPDEVEYASVRLQHDLARLPLDLDSMGGPSDSRHPEVA